MRVQVITSPWFAATNGFVVVDNADNNQSKYDDIDVADGVIQRACNRCQQSSGFKR